MQVDAFDPGSESASALIVIIPRTHTTHVHLSQLTMSIRHRSPEDCPDHSSPLTALRIVPAHNQHRGSLELGLCFIVVARIPIVTLYIYLKSQNSPT